MRISLKIFALMLVAVLAVGCATAPVPPNKTFVRYGPAYNDTMPTVDRMGLLVDGLVAYDGVSARYFDIEDSLAAVSNLTRESEAELKAKGYELAFVESPFVGGFQAGATLSAASGWQADPNPQVAPLRTADYLNADPAYRDILLATSKQIFLAVGNSGRLPTEALQSDPKAKAALSNLAANKHIRYLFVVQGNGVIVSGVKQTGQVLGTSILTAVISLGMVSGSSHNVSFLDSYVSLIDLQTDEVVWSNSLRLVDFNPASQRDYQNLNWAYNLLYWLPPRAKLNPPPS